MVREEVSNNPNKRCAFCKGREVIMKEEDNSFSTNLLSRGDGSFRCKDLDECRQNKESENSYMDFGTDEDGKLVSVRLWEKGEVMFSAEKGDMFSALR